MRIAFYVLLMCFWVNFAHAQQDVDNFCRKLAQHVPIDNVKYDPNEADVPADLNAIPDPVYGSISIPVEINLAEYFDRPDLLAAPGLNLEPEVASIEVNQDGSVFYNGQEISRDIQQFCGASSSIQNSVALPKASAPKPKAEAEAKPSPKPKSKPILKAKPKPKSEPKQSSVSVFNGAKKVITDTPVLEPKKPEIIEKNIIDEAKMDAQNNTDEDDDDTLIEGQYP